MPDSIRVPASADRVARAGTRPLPIQLPQPPQQLLVAKVRQPAVGREHRAIELVVRGGQSRWLLVSML